jgi:hypothetical protein
MNKDEHVKMWENAAKRANDAELARLQRKSGLDLGVRGTHREGQGVTPEGEAAQQRRMRAQEKNQEELDKKKK